MRKCLLLLLLISIFSFDFDYVYADATDELYSEVESTLTDIDFGDIDTFVADLLEDYSIHNVSFQQEVHKLLTGETSLDMTSIFSFVISYIFGLIGRILPSVMLILVVGFISSVAINMYGSHMSSDMVETISVVATILMTVVAFKDVMVITRDVISDILQFISLVGPIMLTLFVSVGSSASVAVFATIFSLVSSIIHFIFDSILYPVMVLSFVIVICDAISSHIRLSKMGSFVYGVFKFVVGITFTIFFAFLSIQSFTIMKYDSISVRATKFAISSYIPLIGSFLSQGFDYVLMGSNLIKNAVGIIGVVVLVIMVFGRVINIVMMRLLYSFSAGILEFVGGDRMSKYLDRFSAVLVMPIVIILASVFFYIVLLMVLVSTANVGVL